MLALHELQQNFVQALRREPSAALPVCGSGLEPAQRLGIYRNNTLLSLTEALRAVYPGVEQLVGARCFERLCRGYILRHPPRAACLLAFGGEFGRFLFASASVRELPYLPGIAQLEWLWHEAYHAAEAGAANLGVLAEIPAERYPSLRFRLHPSVRLLASPYPLLRIWRLCRDGNGGRVELAEGGCRLLLFRPQLQVGILRLGDGEYHFLSALRQGRTLAAAARQGLAAEPGFDLQAALQRGLNRLLLTHFL